MNRILSALLLLIAGGIPAAAQLANWTTGGLTDFPVNSSVQINGFCRISQLKFHPTDTNKMYAVTPQGGLFTTDDGGDNWTVKAGTENYTGYNAAICVDYTNDQVIYLGTGDPDYYFNGNGIYKSTDGGTTFSPTTLTNCLVLHILQSPTASGTFVAATNKGIYKSTDNGANWAATTANIQFVDLQQNAAPNSQVLYACTRETSCRFFRSTDFGSTWTEITSGITTSVGNIQAGGRIGVTPADTNVVYFGAIGGLGIMHRSVDGGLTFTVQKAEGAPNLTGYDTTVAAGAGQGNYNNSITVDRTDATRLWYVSQNMWVSNNSGVNYTYLHKWSVVVHTDAKVIMQAPWNPQKLFATNDGGVWLSQDGGLTWTPKSDGLYAYEIGSNCGKGSRSYRDYVIIGTQDNGQVYRKPAGWYTIVGGDDYQPKEYDYLPNGGYIYNMDGATRRVAPGGANAGYGLPVSSLQQIAFNRTNTSLAFAGNGDIYRTTDLASATPSWTQISAFATPIRAIHSCIADANRLYVITSDNKIHVSADAMSAAPTFTTYNLPSSSANIASIAAIANNANTVYISINAKVYVSTDGGAGWTDITYNLPSVNHRKILAEEYGGTQELVFIATNNAVYYKKAGQATWTNYSTDLPGRRSPTDFSMYDDGTDRALLRYATFGRSIWETSFANLRELTAAIVMNTDSVITCSAPFVEFANASLGTVNTPVSYAWSFPGGTPASSTSATQQVVYPTSGTYDITLTITDALNNTSTKTISRYIHVIGCTADTIPGRAVSINGTTNSINGTTNYVRTAAIPLGTTNTVTMSAWIKLSGTQPSFAGIITTPDGGGCNLNFRNNNQIGYHWNGAAATYNYSGGPTIPTNEWTHVALVITPANATIYVNGRPYTNNVANPAVSFSSEFLLGNDRNNGSRTMNGLIDEVCIYKRALSMQEIRELMNLTRNHDAIDTTLVAYYQCNEMGSSLYSQVGNTHAALQGTAAHTVSSAPVGGGTAQTIGVTTGGTYNFSIPGVELSFPAAGVYPNGNVVVTRLNVPADQPAASNLLPSNPSSYYIIRNYGTNASFSSLTAIRFRNVQGTTGSMVTDPSLLQLYKRGSNDDGATWNTAIDDADTVTDNTGTGTVTFSTGLSNTSFSQFSLGLTGSALPVQLLSFAAESAGNREVLLTWQTGQESAMRRYHIERSADAVRFERIGHRDAAGFRSYNFTDASPLYGRSYYRLALESGDGRVSYSDVRQVDIHTATELSIRPNPSPDGKMSVQLRGAATGSSLHLAVIDGQGKTVRTFSWSGVSNDRPYAFTIPSPGVYIIRAELSDGQTFNRKVVVTR